jgi:hypothetical protein
MDIYEKVILLLDMGDEYCQLYHGPYDNQENHKTVNYLVCPVGYRQSERVERKVRELIIPICQECVDGLYDGEWTLLYCLNCMANQWILRPISRFGYRHNLIWLGSCPKCSKEFKEIYFNAPASEESAAN